MPATDARPAGAEPNQFALLRQRRFAPYFWTQFLGAANDNLFKFALTVMLTYHLQLAWLPPAQAGLAIGALFILPFLLCSATGGQLADKFDKASLIRAIKNFEIAILLAAAAGFAFQAVPLLLGCIFLMGVHSALFGPVKYAYLAQHLEPAELTGGNGMVEMGTFVAILLGNLAGGLLIGVPEHGAMLAAAAGVLLALLGRGFAERVPTTPPTDRQLRIDWNPLAETLRNLRLAAADPVVFRSLIGISWMWFFGAVFLALFSAFAKDVLHGDERVASLLLVVFSLGIGAGSLLCERLSRGTVELGLVPFGAIGMSVFAVELYFATAPLAASLPAGTLLRVGDFLAVPSHWRVIVDLALMAAAMGLYSVPMYALIQLRSPASHRARIIAANNILNAVFMIVSALGVGGLLAAGLDIPQVFIVVGLLNAVASGYVFVRVPQYGQRFAAMLRGRGALR